MPDSHSQDERLAKLISSRNHRTHRTSQSQDTQGEALAKMLSKRGKTYPMGTKNETLAKMISQRRDA